MSSITASIFKAYDIRGIVKTDLTPVAVRQIGQAFASESLEQNCKTVVIARDGRLSSPDLSKALAEGLQAGGCDVIDVGLVPTPVLYFATHHLKTGTGIMITGSHNPPEYNGLKMLIDGNPFYGESIQQLRQRIEDGKLNSGSGNYSEDNVLPTYVETIINDIKLAKPLNIAVDCGNGVASVVAAELFKKLGCNITEMFCEVDGTFPNHHPDPSKLENLKDICAKIESENLDLGLAFDGDGDRVGVIDN
ncbi:MAG: phosphomannomutase/phosphoglucomutase, partial [Gammaproteobacteria bacterium]|nr:phosphomannomutase/phosphoglucomutase [Gammaproteobacteria bacterium]